MGTGAVPSNEYNVHVTPPADEVATAAEHCAVLLKISVTDYIITSH